MANQRVHIWVSGSVQGVFFRYNARQRAEGFGLTGYVRNLFDGRVEIVAEGEKEKLENLLVWARQGPPGAHVSDIEINWEVPTNSFSSFQVTW